MSQEEVMPLFMRAVKEENLTLVHQYLCEGKVDVNEEWSDYRYEWSRYKTALILACSTGNLEMAELLIKGGAMTDHSVFGESALTVASEVGNYEIVELLLEKGARANLQHALRITCEKGYTSLVRVLLEHGAKALVNKLVSISYPNKSPLMIASSHGHDGVAEVLLENSAKVDLQNERGFSALMLSQNGAVAKVLLKYGATVDLLNRRENDRSALIIKASHEDHCSEVVKVLLENGAQVDLQDKNGISALMQTVKCFPVTKELKAVAKLIIKNGAKMDLCDIYGKSALKFSLEHEQTEMTEILLDGGARVDLQDNEGISPLMWVCLQVSPKLKAIELLLRNGATVDLQDNKGMSALLYACQRNLNYSYFAAQLRTLKKEIIKIIQLLAKNSSHSTNNKGESALMLACISDDELRDVIVGTLLNIGVQIDLQNVDGDSALMLACKSHKTNAYNIVNKLLHNGAKVDLQNMDGDSALMLACKNYNSCAYNIVVGLLDSGADVGFKNVDGNSALMLACKSSNNDIVSKLLHSGAAIDSQNKNGKSALMMVAADYRIQASDVMSSLLNKLAKTNLQDNDGETALMIASKCGHHELVQLLLENGATTDLRNKDGKSALDLGSNSEAVTKLLKTYVGSEVQQPENTAQDEQPVSVSKRDEDESEGEDMECSPQDEQPVSMSQDESGDMESSRQHRNKEFIKGIEDAFAKSGKVDKRMAQFMFVGPPESGKSSLMDRLLGRPRKNFSLSTGVSSSIIIVDIDEINQTTFYSAATEEDSDIWKEIEHKASFVNQMAPEKKNRPGNEATGTIVVPPQSEQDTTKSPKVQSESQTSTQSAPSESIASHGRVPSESIESISFKLPSSIVSILEKYSHKIQKKRCSLYFRDTGGQVEFQETLAVVIFGPSLFFFVFNLDLDFKSKFTIQYRSSTSESTNCYTSSITTEEALLQCLASVYAMDTSDEGSVKTHRPLVIIVGTHKDKLGSVADSKITQLNQDLDSLIKRNGFESLVQYADVSEGQVMYAVDNTSDSEEDFKRIRCNVNSLVNIRKEFSIEYPISYLLFCLDLQNIEKSVLSLDECKVLAARYGIEGDEVFHLLHFLHIRTGVILHFNVEGLSHIIVKEPQVLFDKLTTLIVKTFSSKSLTSEEMRSFKTKGILAASTFEDITSSDDKIGHKEFLQLLVHLRIITPFITTDNQEERYFIPCVLNHLNESHEDDLETDILPLAFKFQCCHPPKGLFGVLIIRLITSKSKIEFHLLQDKIYKDQVILEVCWDNDHDEISLKLKPSHLEVKFFPAKSSSDLQVHSVSEVCNAVRESIAECIDQSIEDLHYSKAKVGPEACFKCDTCPELHPVKNETLYCPRKKEKSHIPKDGMYWFNRVTCTQKVLPSDQLTSRKRTLDEDDSLQLPLKRISKATTLEEHQSIDTLTIADHYYVTQYLRSLNSEELVLLGLALGLLYPSLQRMKSTPGGLPNDMIAAWLRKDSNVTEPPTWTSLAAALEKNDHNGLASDIRRDHPPCQAI